MEIINKGGCLGIWLAASVTLVTAPCNGAQELVEASASAVENLKPLLCGDAAALDREAIYFHYPQYHPINTMGPAGAVRMRDHKLAERFEDMSMELYKLRDDVGESKDLSTKMPQLTARM
jgi:hypothetical protein